MTNKTALVTGASDGIGLEFCKILAAKRLRPYSGGTTQRQAQ